MAKIALTDILISARQEASKMRQFYLGVEHLFIALLTVKGGLASSMLQEYGLTAEYAINAIRRRSGKGSQHRLWTGIPNTPRTDIVLGMAHDISTENEHPEIDERDLLIAILEEHDSIPIRVLKALGVDNLEALSEKVRNLTLNKNSQHSYVEILYNDAFNHETPLINDELMILRRMFYGYAQIRVEKRLRGGYSEARLLVVTPIRADSREDASVVVKIDHVDLILDEAQRYENHVKSKLPPLTARIEERPITPDSSSYAGIKYTLIADYNSNPQDLRAILNDWKPDELGQWLKDALFPAFGRTWWQQNTPYRFQVWREYDWLLPPVLTLNLTQSQKITPQTHILKVPIKRAKLPAIEYGDIVSIENFTVQKVLPEKKRIQLAIGHGTDSARAYQIEVNGVNFDEQTYYRGEVVDKIVGTVWKTRQESLIHTIKNLEPNFSVEKSTIQGDGVYYEYLPNPLTAYETVLDYHVNGAVSTIHGDLHLGNIMIGPNNSAFLIDFAHTRDGHTVFDWANLEMSLFGDVIMPKVGESWDDVRRVLSYVVALNKSEAFPEGDEKLTEVFSAVSKVRSIAEECLFKNDSWVEFYIALALCALRATTWENMSLAGRRFMFMLSAVCFQELKIRQHITGEGETPTPDATDINTSI